MADTVLARVNSYRDKLIEQQDLVEWMEDRLSDVIETFHMASLAMEKVEAILDQSRGKTYDNGGGVTLNCRIDSIDLATWTVGQVWLRLKTLDEHMSARFNEIAAVKNAALEKGRAG